MKIKGILSILLVVLMLISVPYAPAIAEEIEDLPIINNASFESPIDVNDVQLYKAERVKKDRIANNTQDIGASDGDYLIKLGMLKPTNPAEVPQWYKNYGRASAGITIRNVKPNTTYQVKIDYLKTSAVSATTGVLDIQGREDVTAGRVKKEPWKMQSAKVDNRKTLTDGWETRTHTIKTSARTNEIYVFAYMDWTGNELQAGEFYIDNVRVTETLAGTDIGTIRADYLPENVEDFPETIPAIQNFEKAEGESFYLASKKQIFSADEFSYDKAKYLADSMVNKGIIESYTLNKIEDVSKGKGIIVVKKPIEFDLPALVKGRECEADSYQIEISKNKVIIHSDYIEGIQNGTMTMLQAFVQRKVILPGTVEDYTDQIIRGLQVDSGRRWYSIDWLKNQIEQMAYYKQNKLQLRLKDNEGIRWASEICPELVDQKGGNWSRAEVKELVSHARKFNIEIIPEVDFPGHADLDANIHAEWRLAGAENVLDISKPEVRDYMFAIYKEAAEFFEAKTVHIGGDEYFQSGGFPSNNTQLPTWAREVSGDPTATQYDALKIFFNMIAAEFKEDGIKTIVWNDNMRTLAGPVPLDKDIIVDFWAGGFYGSITASATANAGYTVMSSSSANYHDIWPQGSDSDTKLDRPEPRLTYDNWSRYHYSKSSYSVLHDEVLTTNLDKSLGQMFPIWDDAHGYVSEYILSRTLFPRYATISYLSWGADYKNQVKFEQFERLMFLLGSPRDDMLEQVVVNYRVVDLQNVASSINGALSTMTSENPGVTANIKSLKKDIDKILANGSKYADKHGFTTDVLNDIIYRFENLEYVLMDKSPLEEIVAVAEKCIEDDALEGSFPVAIKEFYDALEEAYGFLDGYATDEDIINSALRLMDAISMLDWKEGDKTVLVLTVKIADAIEAKIDKYLDTGKADFILALSNARDVIADELAFQEEADVAYRDLMDAMLKLKLKPNKDKLKELLNKARSMDSSQYTVASFRVLADATYDANIVFGDINATEAAVVSSEKAVKTAMDGLVPLVVTTTNGTTTNGTATDGTATTTKASDSDKVIKAADTTTKAATSVPKTGENSLAMLLFTLLSLSCVVTVVIRKKKVK